MRAASSIVIAILGFAGTSHADPQADVRKLVAQQFTAMVDEPDKPGPEMAAVFTADARLIRVEDDGILKAPNLELPEFMPMLADHTEKDIAVTISRDGQSAWLSFATHLKIRQTRDESTTLDMRVSEVAVKTAAGWRIVAGLWSTGFPDAAVNKAAQDHPAKLKPLLPGTVPLENKDLFMRFLELQDHSLDATAKASKDLVAIGSAPGERSVGGASLAAAWDAAWKGHFPMASGSIAAVTPSGHTGYVVTDAFHEKTDPKTKKTYVITFRVMFVFDRTADGSWTLVHAHFAVPDPAP